MPDHVMVFGIVFEPHVRGGAKTAVRQSIVANVNGVLVLALAQGLLLSMGFRFPW